MYWILNVGLDALACDRWWLISHFCHLAEALENVWATSLPWWNLRWHLRCCFRSSKLSFVGVPKMWNWWLVPPSTQKMGCGVSWADGNPSLIWTELRQVFSSLYALTSCQVQLRIGTYYFQCFKLFLFFLTVVCLPGCTNLRTYLIYLSTIINQLVKMKILSSNSHQQSIIIRSSVLFSVRTWTIFYPEFL